MSSTAACARAGCRDLDDATPFVHVGDSEEVLCIGVHVELSRTGEEILLGTMPGQVRLPRTSAESRRLRWLIGEVARELTVDRAGASFASDQLAQLVFLHALRAYINNTGSLPIGWLRAIADDRLGPAVRLMQSDPRRTWRLEELARAASMSRTTFASRFRSTAGVPPLTYLCNWRMRIAAHKLRYEDVSLVALAASLGYTSASAFSNAFKRATGLPPNRYRAMLRQDKIGQMQESTRAPTAAQPVGYRRSLPIASRKIADKAKRVRVRLEPNMGSSRTSAGPMFRREAGPARQGAPVLDCA
jgi:AraC-like DNA-binding protein